MWSRKLGLRYLLNHYLPENTVIRSNVVLRQLPGLRSRTASISRTAIKVRLQLNTSVIKNKLLRKAKQAQTQIHLVCDEKEMNSSAKTNLLTSVGSQI